MAVLQFGASLVCVRHIPPPCGWKGKLCDNFNGSLWKYVYNKQPLSRPKMYSSSVYFLNVKPHKCCVTSVFSLQISAWLLLYSLPLLWLNTAWPPDSRAPLCFFYYSCGLLLYRFGSFLPRHWSYLLVLFVLSFFLSSLLVCISFIPLCPSPIPTSHLQPGYIRDLVSWVMCPLGAFLSLRYMYVHVCINYEHFLCLGWLT